jgi:hypothetical protein
MEVKLQSGKVRENRVRKPYGRDSIELETCSVVQGQRKEERKGLTIGSPPKYRLTMRETKTRIPASHDTKVNASPGMLQEIFLGGRRGVRLVRGLD